MTEDAGLIEAFRRDEDIHASTASRVFDTPLNEVTEDQRRFAKVVNFGLAYGMGEFGLASRADISREEADAIMGEYFRKYPGIAQYLDDARAKVREPGYVEDPHRPPPGTFRRSARPTTSSGRRASGWRSTTPSRARPPT